MKNFTFLILPAMLSVSILTSCQKKENGNRDPGYLASDKKVAELIKSDNAFAFDLLEQTDMINGSDNYMISPLSVSMALGMTYNGAENDTKQAFEQTLRLNGMSRYNLNRIHGDLRDFLVRADPKVTLEIANSIWVHDAFTLMKAFRDTNTYYYNAEVTNLDFHSANATEIINNWVLENTHDKIPEILDNIPSDAVMYLINAIYFKGTWKYAFKEDETGDIPFHYADGSTGNVTAMRINGDFKYYRNDLFNALELPYGDGKFVMDVLLPLESKSVSNVIGWLAGSSDDNWYNDFYEAKGLAVTLPKFKFEYGTLLNDPLTNMGLGIAFTSSADFSGMLEEEKNLAISRVIHKTFIDVNEKGTEAAAATAVEITYTSVSEPSSFIVNRPFLFIIREKSTGAVVFTGCVGRPLYE